MIRLFADTETNGLPDFKLPADHPSQPRMVQLAMVLIETHDDDLGIPAHTELAAYEGIIKPDGWTVPDDVAAIHGLTTAICEERGVPVREALDRFNSFLDQAAEFLTFGVLFDSKILRGELRRAGLPDRFGEKPEACVMRAATPVCKMPPTNAMMAAGRKTFKTPKLGEAHQILLGAALENAHDAMADVRGLIRVWAHLHAKGLMPAAKARPSDPALVNKIRGNVPAPVAAAPATASTLDTF